jgi:hypothetical protein
VVISRSILIPLVVEVLTLLLVPDAGESYLAKDGTRARCVQLARERRTEAPINHASMISCSPRRTFSAQNLTSIAGLFRLEEAVDQAGTPVSISAREGVTTSQIRL